MTGVMNAQIDGIPMSVGVVRPTQGKTPAIMQVCGGSPPLHAVDQMRALGHCMRRICIPNQSSVAKTFNGFAEHDRIQPSVFYDRVAEVMEELVNFTLLTPDVGAHLVARCSERREAAGELSRRVNGSAAI